MYIHCTQASSHKDTNTMSYTVYMRSTELCALIQGYNHPNKYIATQGNVQNVDSSFCFNLLDNV